MAIDSTVELEKIVDKPIKKPFDNPDQNPSYSKKVLEWIAYNNKRNKDNNPTDETD